MFIIIWGCTGEQPFRQKEYISELISYRQGMKKRDQILL